MENVGPSPTNETSVETTNREDIIQDLHRTMEKKTVGEEEHSPFCSSSPDILHTEVIDNHDPRSQREMFLTAKKSKIGGLLSRNTF